MPAKQYLLISHDGTQYPIPTGGLSLGRSSQNQVALSGANLSRQHAQILLANDRVFVRDLSQAGTFINGARVQGQQELRLNDTLTIGGYNFRLGEAPASAPVRAAAPAKSAGFQLVGSDGAVYALTAAGLTLGRSRSNPIVVSGANVSRQHAQILLTDNRVFVRDLSQAGTYVNGARVQGQQELRHNDTLTIGLTNFRLTAAAPAVAAVSAQGKRSALAYVMIGGFALVAVVLAVALGSGGGGGAPAAPGAGGSSSGVTQPAAANPTSRPVTSGGGQPAPLVDSEPVSASLTIDEDAPPPPLSPEDIAGAGSAFDSPFLSDPAFDPNGDTPLMMVENGFVYIHAGGTWTAYPDPETIGMHLPLQPVVQAGYDQSLTIETLSGLNPLWPNLSSDVAWLGGSELWLPDLAYRPSLGIMSTIGSVASYINPAPIGSMVWDGANNYVFEPIGDGLDYAGDKLGQAAGMAWDGANWVLDASVDVVTWTSQQTVDGIMWVWDGTKYVAYQTGRAGQFVLVKTAEGSKWTWEKINNLYQWVTIIAGNKEFKCGLNGEPGPGPGPDGNVSGGTFDLRSYPKPGYLNSYTADQQARLALAQNWMPLIQPSKDETCGEILRVIASVFAYKSGEVVNSLAAADSAEIVYTVLYRRDGGRWYIDPHPGDNEGFVIGLARTKRSDGRCGLTDPRFEFQSGRTVKHKDILEELVPSWLKAIFPAEYFIAHNAFEAAKLGKEIEDFSFAPCPDLNDQGYKLWASENKHANYFDPQECEQTLGGFRLSGVSIVGGELDLTIGGLEECESGRPAYNLRNQVELLNEGMKSEPDSTERSQFVWNKDWDSYYDAARGKNYDPNDFFHVTRLECYAFDEDRAIAITMDGVPDNSDWVITAIGLDGFDPVLRIGGSPPICDDDSPNANENSINGLPGFGNLPANSRIAQVEFTAINGDSRTIYVDAADGRPGRFALVIQSPNGGNAITPLGDEDRFYVEGIADGYMVVYTLAESSDLDLFLENPDNDLSNDDRSENGSIVVNTILGTTYGNSTDPYIYLTLGSSTHEREFVVSGLSSTGRYTTVIVADTIGGLEAPDASGSDSGSGDDGSSQTQGIFTVSIEPPNPGVGQDYYVIVQLSTGQSGVVIYLDIQGTDNFTYSDSGVTDANGRVVFGPIPGALYSGVVETVTVEAPDLNQKEIFTFTFE